jgi:hypothetical protein
MGFSFKKTVGKAVGGVAGGGIGSLLGPAGTVIGAGLGASGGLGAITDVLLGKKDPGTKDRYTELDPLQKVALGKYGELLGQDTDSFASNAVQKAEEQARANAGDLERKATQLVAQRGLGNSSVGLNAIINSTRNLGDQVGAIRSSLPIMKYDMKVNNLGNAANGINGILDKRMFIQGNPSTGRSGGLLGLGLGGLGAYYGGPGGAQAGMGLGRGLANFG